MQATNDDFQYWLFEMDDRLEAFVNDLPNDVADALDYSPNSLLALEGWLLGKYGSINEVMKPAEKDNLDGASRYVGETFCKNVGGAWSIDQEDIKNAYYRIPVVGRKGVWTECPPSLVTAAIDRRRGDFIISVLKSFMRYAVPPP